jgi:MFS family permease
MTDTKIHDSPYSWFRLAITLLVSTIGSVGIWAIIIVLPLVQDDLGIDRSAASLLYTLSMIGFAAGNLIIGRLVDKFGFFSSLLLATVCTSIGFLGASYAQSVEILTVWQILLGFGAAIGFGPLMADISHWFQKRRGIALAVAASGNYLSGAIWPIVLKGVLVEQGWRDAYFFIAMTVLIALIPLSLFLLRRIPIDAIKISEMASQSKSKALRISPRFLQILLALAGLSCCIAMSMPQVHIVSFCMDLGYGPAIGAEMLSLMLFGGVVSRIFSGFIADWIGGIKTVLLGSSLQCLALFLYLPFDGLVSLYIVSLIFGLSQGGIVPSYAVIVREYLPAREAGQRVGLVVMSTILGMAVGGWMSGWIFDLTGSYRAAFFNGIAWNILNIVIMLSILIRLTNKKTSIS